MSSSLYPVRTKLQIEDSNLDAPVTTFKDFFVYIPVTSSSN
jgi:hypothetical protein